MSNLLLWRNAQARQAWSDLRQRTERCSDGIRLWRERARKLRSSNSAFCFVAAFLVGLIVGPLVAGLSHQSLTLLIVAVAPVGWGLAFVVAIVALRRGGARQRQLAQLFSQMRDCGDVYWLSQTLEDVWYRTLKQAGVDTCYREAAPARHLEFFVGMQAAWNRSISDFSSLHDYNEFRASLHDRLLGKAVEIAVAGAFQTQTDIQTLSFNLDS